jgi:hypothetical protein
MVPCAGARSFCASTISSIARYFQEYATFVVNPFTLRIFEDPKSEMRALWSPDDIMMFACKVLVINEGGRPEALHVQP